MENRNKYQNGKIYKITDNAYTECYIGSTTQPLCNRMADHRKKYKAYKIGTGCYVSVFDLFDKYGIEHCKIELIRDVPCERREQLGRMEGEYIKKIKCTNRKIEGRTRKEYRDEYYETKREKVAEQCKRYKEANKEKIKCYMDNWREVNKEDIQAYRDNNKEHKRETTKAYYDKNKQQIRELRQRKYPVNIERNCYVKIV